MPGHASLKLDPSSMFVFPFDPDKSKTDREGTYVKG